MIPDGNKQADGRNAQDVGQKEEEVNMYEHP